MVGWRRFGAGMFQNFIISFTILPILVGMLAAKGRGGARDRAAVRVGWIVYAVLWFGALYYLRYRWT
jgi:hypothetical protein